MGLWQYVNVQLNPQSIPDPFSGIHTGPIEASRRDPIELLAEYNQRRATEKTGTMNFANNVVRGRRVKSETQEFIATWTGSMSRQNCSGRSTAQDSCKK